MEGRDRVACGVALHGRAGEVRVQAAPLALAGVRAGPVGAHTALRGLQTVRVAEFKALKIRRKPPPQAPSEASETTKSGHAVITRE